MKKLYWTLYDFNQFSVEIIVSETNPYDEPDFVAGPFDSLKSARAYLLELVNQDINEVKSMKRIIQGPPTKLG